MRRHGAESSLPIVKWVVDADQPAMWCCLGSGDSKAGRVLCTIDTGIEICRRLEQMQQAGQHCGIASRRCCSRTAAWRCWSPWWALASPAVALRRRRRRRASATPL